MGIEDDMVAMVAQEEKNKKLAEVGAAQFMKEHGAEILGSAA